MFFRWERGGEGAAERGSHHTMGILMSSKNESMRRSENKGMLIFVMCGFTMQITSILDTLTRSYDSILCSSPSILPSLPRLQRPDHPLQDRAFPITSLGLERL